MIEYAIPTLNQLPWVRDKHLPSLDFSLFSRVSLIVSEMDEQKAAICQELITRYPLQITYADYNVGVAGSWNAFMSQAMLRNAHAIILANDDIEHKGKALASLCEALKDHPFAYIAAPASNMYSCFGLQLSVPRYVGMFDIEFSPAYFEDNDYDYRLKLAGVPVHRVEGDYFHKGSATLGLFDWQRRQMHHHNFRKNAEYYVRKWGGMPGDERYTVPFNGE